MGFFRDVWRIPGIFGESPEFEIFLVSGLYSRDSEFFTFVPGIRNFSGFCTFIPGIFLVSVFLSSGFGIFIPGIFAKSPESGIFYRRDGDSFVIWDIPTKIHIWSRTRYFAIWRRLVGNTCLSLSA